MEHEIHSKTKVVNCISPQALAANTNGAWIDTLGFESLEYVIQIGVAFAGGGFNFSFQESPTGAGGGEETTVPAGHIIGQTPVIVATDANKLMRVGVVGKERYQRIVLTETGTISAGIVGVLGVLSHPKNAPVPDQYT